MGVLTARISSIVILLFFAAAATAGAQKLKTYNKNYSSFDTVNKSFFESIFEFEAEAEISKGALQVTPEETLNPETFSLFNRSGRVLLKRSFKLWDGDLNADNSTRVASFNTSFLVNIFPLNNNPFGEGLSFVIAPNLDLPLNSSGEFLGLTNASTDGNAANRIIAVELDTVQQEFDPDGDHVGLNINSVRSVKTERLAPHDIQLATDPPRFHNVWVNYDGIEKVIRVYVAQQVGRDDPTPPMPPTPMIEWSLDLRRFVAQKSYFGFAASTGNDTKQLNCVRRWNLTVEYFPGEGSPAIRIALGVGIPVVVILLAAMAALGYYIHKRRKVVRSQSNILSRLRTLPGMPREFKYKELKKATNNFDEKRKLGQGGYGVVYRGMLPDEDLEFAVKCFSRESLKGETDFLAELTIINRLRHKHLVRLLGWCHKNGKLLLVYEYMPKGSLDMHLFATQNTVPLSWNLRYKIISGVASALHYLHYEYDQKVVHRDIKASNIMLDSNFNARLGDFGLARALDNEKTSYAEAEGVLGTVGYIAPECFHTGKATQHSDVYAFGAVLMEVVCGQRPGMKIGGFQYLVDWVWSLYREGRILDAVDERLMNDYEVEEAERLLLLGLACSHPIASERPKTQVIVQIISGSVPVPSVPPFKPAFVWPAMMPIGDLTEAFSIDTTSLSTSHLGSDWTPHYLSRENYSGYTDRSMV